MAKIDSVSVRVFSLNCWLVDVICRDSSCIVFGLSTCKTNCSYFWLFVCLFVLFFFRGIHYLSKHCRQRYALIGDMLCKEEHDIVLLQEVGGRFFLPNFIVADPILRLS